MPETLTFPTGHKAREACFDAIATAFPDGPGDTAESAAYAEKRAVQIKAEYAMAEEAENLLQKMTNSGTERAFVELLASEHPYLLDKIAWTVLKAVSTRIARSDGYVDGRISPTLADFVKANVSPLR